MTKKFLTPIVLPADPAAAMEAATKQYVDSKSAGAVQEVAVQPNDPGTTFDLWYDTDEPSTGNGLPSGGTAGQIIVKSSAADFAVQWDDGYADKGTLAAGTDWNNLKTTGRYLIGISTSYPNMPITPAQGWASILEVMTFGGVYILQRWTAMTSGGQLVYTRQWNNASGAWHSWYSPAAGVVARKQGTLGGSWVTGAADQHLMSGVPLVYGRLYKWTNSVRAFASNTPSDTAAGLRIQASASTSAGVNFASGVDHYYKNATQWSGFVFEQIFTVTSTGLFTIGIQMTAQSATAITVYNENCWGIIEDLGIDKGVF